MLFRSGAQRGGGLPAVAVWGIAGALLATFAAKTLVVDPRWRDHRRTHFDVMSGASFGQLILMGADRLPPVPSGGRAEVVLYWRVPAVTANEYSTSVQVVDASGLFVAGADNQHPGNVPTTYWSVEQYARDSHGITLPAGAPPGQYTVRVAVYPYGKPEETLSLLDAAGAPAGRWVDLMPLTVVRPQRSPSAEGLHVGHRLDVPVVPGLVLLGLDPPARSVRAGDRLPLTWYWACEQALPADLRLDLLWLDAQGQVAVRQGVAPVPGYDTVHVSLRLSPGR